MAGSSDGSTEEFMEEMYVNTARVVVAVGGVFLITFVLGNLLHKYHVSCIPESFVVIVMGALLAWFINGMSSIHNLTLDYDVYLNKTILSLLCLPIIIFEAGWSLKHRDFMSQLPYILLFAVAGTIISMLVVASLILATSSIHGIEQPRVALTFAALISAVDPVATLSTYAHLQVEPLLNVLVLGESIVNDAVAIVLFETLNKPPAGGFSDKSPKDVTLEILEGVSTLMGGSAGLGIGLGILFVLIIRFTRLRYSPALQIMFVFISTFFTYAFTEEVCKMSPIICVLFSAMIQSAYATPHLGLEGNMLCSFFLKQMAGLADMTVFLFVGIAMVFQTKHGLTFGLLLIPICLLGRAVATFPLGLLTNCIKRVAGKDLSPEHKLLLKPKHMFMMWHAGLRGGIALVLTLQMGSWVDELDGERTLETLRNGTVILICVFLLVFGGSTEFFLRVLDVPRGGTGTMYHHPGRFYMFTQRLHHKYLNPLLVGKANTELRMEGGIITMLMEQAHTGVEELLAMKPESTSMRQNSERAANMFDLFGDYNPGIPEPESEVEDDEEFSESATENDK